MLLINGLISGLVATLLFDIYQFLLSFAYGINKPKWNLVGRYFIGLKYKKFYRENLAEENAEKNELLYGYLTHYIIGIIYGYFYVILNYIFFDKISLFLALIIGFITVLGNWLIMMPYAFNLGFFASKLDEKYQIMIQNLLAHFIFGIGLYIGYLTVY